MTIPELIQNVVAAIGRQFYADRVNEFMRDLHGLRQAVTRYGYECERRNWQFEPDFILRDLMGLLNQLKVQGTAGIQYFPRYLEGAVDRHIRLRADELNAEAKALAPKVQKTIRRISVVQAIREPTAVEILAAVHTEEKRLAAERKAARKNRTVLPAATVPKPQAQGALL